MCVRSVITQYEPYVFLRYIGFPKDWYEVLSKDNSF